MADLVTVLLITTVAGLVTGLGAVPVLFETRISHRVYDGAVAFAAGVMLGAAVFSLIDPGIELGTVGEVVVGVAAGAAFLLAANRAIPHVHAGYLEWTSDSGTDRAPETDDSLRKAVLIGGSITLHNAPEGLAIGIAFASGLEGVGTTLAFVIGIQNIPDGFAFAVPAGVTGLSKARIVGYTTLSGALPQPVAAALGFALVELSEGVFPVAAGFAAGAMIAVVFREMIPSSHGHGYSDVATSTFVVGFLLILVVDTVLVF